MNRNELKEELLKLKINIYKERCLNKNIKDSIIEHTDYLNGVFSERVYHIINDLTASQICKNSQCNASTKFISSKVGYSLYCSSKCSNSCKEKIESTISNNMKKYGVSNPMKLTKIQKKVEETNIKNNGVKYPAQNKKILLKQIETRKNKSKDKKIEILERTKNTNLKKYGVDNPMKVSFIREKVKETNLKKYGVSEVAASQEIRNKIKNTCLYKYGVDNPSKSDEIVEKISKTKQKKYIEKMLPIYLETFNLILLDKNFISASYRHKWKCLICGIEFEQLLNSIQGGYICPGCFPRKSGISKGEKEVVDFIKSLSPELEIIENSKKIISPKEIDIFISSHNIAFEYNGLWNHSEDCDYGGKDSNYHISKTLECEKLGIRLIHIFEDEWLFKKEIVKNRIKSILGFYSKSKRIHARKCEIKEIDSTTKNNFLEKFHLQASDKSKIKLGAFYADELISVMTFSTGNISKGSKVEDGIWELNRFCTNYNYHIPGIAGKLLSYFKKNYEWKKIYSYADRRWSNGNLYYKIGFNFEKETTVNYWYLKGFKRIHRFSLRKKSIDPKEIPEWILRKNEGYNRIWDCGSLKFKMKNEDNKC